MITFARTEAIDFAMNPALWWDMRKVATVILFMCVDVKVRDVQRKGFRLNQLNLQPQPHLSPIHLQLMWIELQKFSHVIQQRQTQMHRPRNPYTILSLAMIKIQRSHFSNRHLVSTVMMISENPLKWMEWLFFCLSFYEKDNN